MRLKIIHAIAPALMLCCALLPRQASGEVAIIPYKTEDASVDFSTREGAEYAKLLGVAVSVLKGMDVYSPRELENDLRGFSIDPEGVITREKLMAFGKGRYIDLVLVGTLTKRRGVYTSESVLYSVPNNYIVSKCSVSSDSIYRCAEKDIREVFINVPDREIAQPGGEIDVAVVADLSYNVSREWESVKKGIVALAEAVSDKWRNPLKLYLIPYSGAHAAPRGYRPLSGPASLNRELGNLKPKGGNSGEALEKALSAAVGAVPWRAGSAKLIVLISNSPAGGAGYVQGHALRAMKKNIPVYALSLGKHSDDDAAIMRRIAETSRGVYMPAAYRQRMYDRNGRSVDVFMEAGRMFRGQVSGWQWKEGLTERRAASGAQPKPWLSEIMFDENKYSVTPYSLDTLYPDISGAIVVNREPLENNADTVLEVMGGRFEKLRGGKSATRSIARVLLSDQRLSVWARVMTKRDLEFFRARQRSGMYFPLGVFVRNAPDEPYGFTFSGRYVTGLSNDYIPDLSRAPLKNIIDAPARYTDTGLFRPPVWFVDVRVERVEGADEGEDIRGR